MFGRFCFSALSTNGKAIASDWVESSKKLATTNVITRFIDRTPVNEEIKKQRSELYCLRAPMHSARNAVNCRWTPHQSYSPPLAARKCGRSKLEITL